MFWDWLPYFKAEWLLRVPVADILSNRIPHIPHDLRQHFSAHVRSAAAAADYMIRRSCKGAASDLVFSMQSSLPNPLTLIQGLQRSMAGDRDAQIRALAEWLVAFRINESAAIEPQLRRFITKANRLVSLGYPLPFSVQEGYLRAALPSSLAFASFLAHLSVPGVSRPTSALDWTMKLISHLELCRWKPIPPRVFKLKKGKGTKTCFNCNGTHRYRECSALCKHRKCPQQDQPHAVKNCPYWKVRESRSRRKN